MFNKRSTQPERIDTGDYTADEYDRFLVEIKFVNQLTGDNRILRKTLPKEVEKANLPDFSVLDVGAGSGELLRTVAKFARRTKRRARLFGLELNKRSAESILEESADFKEISSIRGNALALPFADNSFDYVISSLFTHHLSDAEIIQTLQEMNRVAIRRIFIIDLHRHPVAYGLYKIFCLAFRISPLVRQDGSLSILKSFKSDELHALAEQANLQDVRVERHFPFRLLLTNRQE